jgi:hypothetical protein
MDGALAVKVLPTYFGRCDVDATEALNASGSPAAHEMPMLSSGWRVLREPAAGTVKETPLGHKRVTLARPS